MFLDYGTTRLKIIDLTRFEREAVWSDDRADLLHVLTTLGVTSTYAPGGFPRLPSITQKSENTTKMLTGADTTSDDLRANPRGFDPGVKAKVLDFPVFEDSTPGSGPVAKDAWHSGPETDSELYTRLMTPRQKLILWAYDRQTGRPIRWIESPRPGFATDMTNGPTPLSCDVVSASGEPSAVGVHFQVQTALSPCPIGSDRLVLSHRWQMSHGHDEDYYLTRIIDGTIVFNGAVVRALGVLPDHVRAQFMHPIPVGFHRGPPEIIQSSDGLTIRYRITDTDPTITFDPANSGATRMTIAERVNYFNPWSVGPSSFGGQFTGLSDMWRVFKAAL